MTEVEWTVRRAAMFAYIDATIETHPPELRPTLRRMVDAGAYRVLTSLAVDERGIPAPESLTCYVELPCSDGGWATLCTVHWTRLGMTAEQVADEYEVTLLQNGSGCPTTRGRSPEARRPTTTGRRERTARRPARMPPLAARRAAPIAGHRCNRHTDHEGWHPYFGVPVPLLDDLREKRATARSAAEAILTRAAADERSLSPDEITEHARHVADERAAADEIERWQSEQIAEIRAAAARSNGRPVLSRARWTPRRRSGRRSGRRIRRRSRCTRTCPTSGRTSYPSRTAGSAASRSTPGTR